MDHQLLRSWLNLPPEPWPPEHYALLGLPAGEGDNAGIEQRVLERMDLLRRYQLINPDEATEGMNLLAQAMICLTDPRSRRDYDLSLERGPIAAEEELPLELDDNVPLVPLIEVPQALPPERRTAATLTLPYPLAVETRTRPEPEKEARPLRPRSRPAGTSRRQLYADLVRIRRVIRIWEQLRNFLDEPDRTFSRRTETVAFMACLRNLQPLLPTVADLVGGTQQPGSLVATLSRQQLIVDMFRSLLPDQREALARDCRAAHVVLREAYQERRDEVRAQTAKGFERRVWRPIWREVVARPEWLMLLTGVVALVIAFVRSVPR